MSDKSLLRETERAQAATRDPALNALTARIARLGRDGDWEGALRVYSQAEKKDCALFSAALNACCRALRLQEAIELWRDNPAELRSVISYSIMIQLCGRLKKADDATRLFAEMREVGIEPNVITYTSLIHAQSAAGRPQDALATFEQLRAGLLPRCSELSQQMAYSAAMTAVARAGDYARARELFTIMVDASVQPSQMHFNALMSACARTADAETAKGVFDTMLGWKLEPRVDDYTILISCSRNSLQRCLDIWADLERAGKQPNAITFQEMLQAHLIARDGPGAHQLLQKADAAGVKLTGRKVDRMREELAALP